MRVAIDCVNGLANKVLLSHTSIATDYDGVSSGAVLCADVARCLVSVRILDLTVSGLIAGRSHDFILLLLHVLHVALVHLDQLGLFGA